MKAAQADARACTRRACLRAGAGGLLPLTAAVATLQALLAPGSAQAEGTAAVAATAPTPVIGEPVQWPRVQLLDGRRFEPPQPGQEATVVVFFSITCPFCARHNAHVQKLLDSRRGLPLRVLGVAHERRPEWVQTYLSRRGLGFDVSLDEGPLHAALSRKRGVPLTCVVDRQQRLREVIRGEMFEDDVLGLARWARA